MCKRVSNFRVEFLYQQKYLIFTKNVWNLTYPCTAKISSKKSKILLKMEWTFTQSSIIKWLSNFFSKFHSISSKFLLWLRSFPIFNQYWVMNFCSVRLQIFLIFRKQKTNTFCPVNFVAGIHLFFKENLLSIFVISEHLETSFSANSSPKYLYKQLP